MKKLLCLFGVLALITGCSKEEVDDWCYFKCF